METFVVALVAASLSTLGSLILQMYVARTTRRLTFDDRRLSALLDVRQAVEMACGRWYGWASAVLAPASADECRDHLRRAEESMHEGWYATRVFEIYFPAMLADAQSMREEMTRYRVEAQDQVSRNEGFDGDALSAMSRVDFDDVVRRARQALGFPEA